MRLLSAMWGIIARWYVSAVLLTAVGIAIGYFVFFNLFPGRPQIGVIDVPFTLINDDSAFVIGEMLSYAHRNDSIKAVVVRLVTPGGNVATSESLYLKIVALSREKPVVMSLGRIAASGGVLMSIGASYIYAEPGGFVGGIGLIHTPQKAGRPNEALIVTGPGKVTGGTYQTFTGMIEVLKNSFIQRVVFHRGDKLRLSPAELAEARLYLGLQAKELGLVDAIGTDFDAIRKAASLAGVSNYELVDVNEKVLRQFVLKQERIFGRTEGEEDRLQWPDIGRLRGIASAYQGADGPRGVPPDFPVEVNLPGMYYLYVTPPE